jgi:hypothetical protein
MRDEARPAASQGRREGMHPGTEEAWQWRWEARPWPGRPRARWPRLEQWQRCQGTDGSGVGRGGRGRGGGGGDGRPVMDGVAAARREKRNPKQLIPCRR